MNAAPTNPRLIGVLCVDDVQDVTMALRLIIATDPTMVCLGCLSSADNLLMEVERFDPRPDVLILDATMPGRSPFVAMRELADRWPETRAIIYSGYDQGRANRRAYEAGAWGFVSKHEDPEVILQAVRDVAAGRFSRI